MVIRGGGRMKLDDEIVELGELDAVPVPPEVVRNIEAGSGGIEVIAVGAPLTEADRGEMLQSWWVG